MGKTALNDMIYNFEPLEIFVPNPEERVDEAELEKSMEKSRELIAFIQDYKKRKIGHTIVRN